MALDDVSQQAGSDIRIRPFDPRDQVAARRLILNGLGEHWGFIDETLNPDIDAIDAHYLQPGHLFVVAEHEGEIVGTGGLIAEGADTMRMVRISVHRERRRLGLGRRLVEHLVAAARQRGVGRVVVETTNTWQDAIGMYLNCGFTQYAEDEHDVHFVRELKPLDGVLSYPRSATK
jgi:GNAT superfamily N-acetyltransferase